MSKVIKYWTEEELKFLSDNYESMLYSDIAISLGRSKTSVSHKLMRLGLHVGEPEQKKRSAIGIKRRRNSCEGFIGVNNPNWKGGVTKDNYRYTQRYRERYPEKVKANKLVERAIKNGSLVRQPCMVCGEPDAAAHHEDYSKPLEVIWFCQKHHNEYHKNLQDSKKTED